MVTGKQKNNFGTHVILPHVCNKVWNIQLQKKKTARGMIKPVAVVASRPVQ